MQKKFLFLSTIFLALTSMPVDVFADAPYADLNRTVAIGNDEKIDYLQTSTQGINVKSVKTGKIDVRISPDVDCETNKHGVWNGSECLTSAEDICEKMERGVWTGTTCSCPGLNESWDVRSLTCVVDDNLMDGRLATNPKGLTVEAVKPRELINKDFPEQLACNNEGGIWDGDTCICPTDDHHRRWNPETKTCDYHEVVGSLSAPVKGLDVAPVKPDTSNLKLNLSPDVDCETNKHGVWNGSECLTSAEDICEKMEGGSWTGSTCTCPELNESWDPRSETCVVDDNLTAGKLTTKTKGLTVDPVKPEIPSAKLKCETTERGRWNGSVCICPTDNVNRIWNPKTNTCDVIDDDEEEDVTKLKTSSGYESQKPFNDEALRTRPFIIYKLLVTEQSKAANTFEFNEWKKACLRAGRNSHVTKTKVVDNLKTETNDRKYYNCVAVACDDDKYYPSTEKPECLKKSRETLKQEKADAKKETEIEKVASKITSSAESLKAGDSITIPRSVGRTPKEIQEAITTWSNACFRVKEKTPAIKTANPSESADSLTLTCEVTSCIDKYTINKKKTDCVIDETKLDENEKSLKNICEKTEKGRWVIREETSTCVCPKTVEGYFFDKELKKCIIDSDENCPANTRYNEETKTCDVIPGSECTPKDKRASKGKYNSETEECESAECKNPDKYEVVEGKCLSKNKVEREQQKLQMAVEKEFIADVNKLISAFDTKFNKYLKECEKSGKEIRDGQCVDKSNEGQS